MMVVHSSFNGKMDNLHPLTVLSRLSEQRLLGLFCDVTIVVEDIKFRAHRNVLAATSGYFRSAFTAPETCTSSQVLEIPDLKSEVFASILNFIYSSKVDLASKADNKSFIAAGKKLGIPFLEKLLDIERQDSRIAPSQTVAKAESSVNQTKLSVCCTLKKEAPRPEEQECSKGPRITNAFSITEVPEVNNPFTSVDSHSTGQQSPDMTHQPLSGVPSVESDSVDAMFEHSYAVSQGHQTSELKETVQENDKETIKPVVSPCKTLTNHRLGPIKKRHRLCKALAPVSNEPSESIPVSSSVVQDGPPDSTSMLQSSSSNSPSCSAPELLPPPEILPPQDDDPPSLVPEDVPTSTTYRCLQCPEAFSSSALLGVHMQSHKRRFVSHLFCKYCYKKFIHLKRLRNHEQVCLKVLPQLESNGKEASVGLDSNSTPVLNDESSASSDLPETPQLDSTLSRPLEAPQEVVPKSSSKRVYKCSVCKRAYVTLSSLKRHENVHSWQRAYPCHYCNKVFALAEYRTKHEIWHTGERRYQCIFCLETFLTYYILKNHQKSFHGIDPRLAVKKKSANGSFKGSVYPIKLYRLLPMKFKKKRYKTYSHTYSEAMGSQENSFAATPDLNLQEDLLKGTDPIRNPESAPSGQSLFSMPVTFMATPKMVASEMPHITFDQPCDQHIETRLDKNSSRVEDEGFTATNTRSGLAGFQANVSPVFGCGYSPSLTTEDNTRSSIIRHRNDSSSSMQCSSSTSRDGLPFLNIPPVCSFEGLSKLSELSAAAQTIEVMANQLLQPQPETLTQNLRPDGKTETYIAKPACPGPSVNSQVLPLCQITVKIGNEAIIRRKIKGSKLFPKRKKRRTWNQDNKKGDCAEDDIGFPNLRFRTELSSSVPEDEPYDDANDPENDNLWRPYYTYKPKKKGKRFRSKRKRLKAAQYYTKPLSPEPEDDFVEMNCGLEERAAAEKSSESRMELRSQSPKETFTCRRCSGSFATSAALSMHVIDCHQPCCKICGKQCPLEELPNPAEDFACQSCTEDGSCFNSTEMTRSLSTEKRYRCSYCPQRFLYLATKRSHEAKHLERFSTELSCQYCSKVCKSALLLSIHESKHFNKVKEAENSEIKPMARSYIPATESKEQPKIEPLSPKTEEALDATDAKGILPKLPKHHKKSSLLLSYKGDRTSSPFHPEMQRRKSKKKGFVEFSKDSTLGLFETGAHKSHIPKSLTNNHLNSSNLYTTCLTRVPAIKGASLQSSKSEWHMCKEEPVFYTHN